jgi:hypothetical protein
MEPRQHTKPVARETDQSLDWRDLARHTPNHYALKLVKGVTFFLTAAAAGFGDAQ